MGPQSLVVRVHTIPGYPTLTSTALHFWNTGQLDTLQGSFHLCMTDFLLPPDTDPSLSILLQVNLKPCLGFIIIIFCLFAISWVASAAYGGSQARGRIGAVATGLYHNHSNTGSEPHLQPIPQLTAMPDP